jgi:hypothetical protein
MKNIILFTAILALTACQDDYPSPYGRATARIDSVHGGGKGVWDPKAQTGGQIGSSNANLDNYIARLPKFEQDAKLAPPRPAVLLTPEQVQAREAELTRQRGEAKARF